MADDKPIKHGIRFKDLTGQRFHKLTVLAYAGSQENTQWSLWLCRCDCGNDTVVTVNKIRRTKSCGCLTHQRAINWKHGKARTREYNSWLAARDRTCNQQSSNYWRYGGRGITLCEEWKDSFQQFFDDMGPRPNGMSLERVDNDGPYSKANCIWATQHTQTRNTRRTILVTHNGETLALKDWAERTGISYHTLRHRYHGRSKASLFDPVRKPKRSH